MINKNVFERTKNRLIKINVMVVGGFLILFSLCIYVYFQGLTYNTIDKKLEEELEYVTSQFSNNSFFNPIVIKDPGDLVYIYEGERIRYYTQNRYFETIVPPNNENKKDVFFTFTHEGYTFRELNVGIGMYKIQIIKNIDSQISSLRQLVFTFIIGILIAMLITYFVAIYLTKKALVPIETAWINQEKFIQDASHELRTPISIVSSKLEYLLKVPNNSISDEVETVADAMKEIRRVKKMITDLLSLSKEDSIITINEETFELDELIDDLSKDYKDIADIQGKNFEIEHKLMNNIVFTDKNKLRQLIVILIDNAFKYTKKNDSVYIILSENKNNIIITVGDTGIGIEEDEINNIFDRFFRSSNVRNKDIEGSGIGLSIAKMLVLNLKGEIKVTSKIDTGTEFKIYIPRS